MRFVAGRGAVAKRLAALWRIAIGKKQAGALRRISIGKMLLAREPIKTIIGKNLLAKAHKNPDFVLEKPENGGSEGQKSTKTTILCSGGLVCALSVGRQLAGSRKHPAGNQKKTACNQKQTRPEPKHPGRPPETNRLVSKKSAGAPR